MKSKALREQRAKLAAEIKKLADLVNAESRDFTAEERPQWEKINADYDALTRQIVVAERAETIEAEQRAPAHDDGALPGAGDMDSREDRRAETRAPEEVERDRNLAMVAWFRNDQGLDVTREQREACRRVGFNPQTKYLPVRFGPSGGIAAAQRAMRGVHASRAMEYAARAFAEQRADMSAFTGADGGFTVPQGFVNALEIALLQYGPMLQVAEILRTDSGNDLPWPTADDTSNTGEQLGESVSVGSTVKPTIGATILKAYKFSSKLIKVPYELIEDSAFDIPSLVGGMLGERLGRILNTQCTTGTGAATCQGIVTGATSGVTTGTATKITADEIIDLVHSIDPAYRVGPNVGFMFSDTVLAYVRKLKTGTGDYIWKAGIDSGAPDRLFGYPYYINQDMVDTTSGLPVTATKTMIFGDLSKYKIRQVRGMRLRRLVERFADYDQEGYVAFMRADGHVLDAGTHPIKYMLQA